MRPSTASSICTDRYGLATMTRLHNFPQDDGHAIKLARAAVICRQNANNHENREWMVLKGEDVWSKINHLIVDSVEAPGATWVRTAGLDEAWADIPNKSRL